MIYTSQEKKYSSSKMESTNYVFNPQNIIWQDINSITGSKWLGNCCLQSKRDIFIPEVCQGTRPACLHKMLSWSGSMSYMHKMW